jgi:uncharacterized membrane protein YgdD (TMEM256/DUF423 family)
MGIQTVSLKKMVIVTGMEKPKTSRRPASQRFLLFGSLSAALAVGAGAFGAHGLQSVLSERMLAVYDTAFRYHMFHALGLAVIAAVAHWKPASKWVERAGYTLLAGKILFSGSLYALALSGIGAFGAITPFGGTALILAWLFLARAALEKP